MYMHTSRSSDALTALVGSEDGDFTSFRSGPKFNIDSSEEFFSFTVPDVGVETRGLGTMGLGGPGRESPVELTSDTPPLLSLCVCVMCACDVCEVFVWFTTCTQANASCSINFGKPLCLT